MNMISKGIIGFFAALITIASSAAYAQDTGFQPSGGDEAGPLDQVVPVAEDDAAEPVALHNRCFHAELCGADRSDIAAGAGADDDEIEFRVCHGATGLVRSSQSPLWGKPAGRMAGSEAILS